MSPNTFRLSIRCSVKRGRKASLNSSSITERGLVTVPFVKYLPFLSIMIPDVFTLDDNLWLFLPAFKRKYPAAPRTETPSRVSSASVSYTHLTLPTIYSV
eukprot:TRINITY_DN18768_c0_g1_i1.p1 TRINITY_DN18768_c0_g1~~TRINITY_DN18768_c0_g1_i1.p1  ORF type:complete len:100 (+),score=7.17 TRINITY_DN18768_c0_g1_i1:91-390(+)